MAMKTANLFVRIEPQLKEEAESILASLGIPVSNAINMFYNQIVMQRGIPFELKVPLDWSKLTDEERAAEIQKGIDDMEAGRVVDAKEAMERIRKELGF